MKRDTPWLWRSLFVCIVLLLALLPVKTVAAPDWSACVVDETSRPLPGILVRESYQNYSVESEGHEEDQYSGCERLRSLPSEINERVTFQTIDRRRQIQHGWSSCQLRPI